MKKVLLTICLAAASLTTFAQSDDAPVTFGIKGGINFSTLAVSVDAFPGRITSSSLTLFHAGVFVDFKIADAFSIQPAMLYTGKGGLTTISGSGQVDGDQVSFTGVSNDKVNYLHVPVNFLYHVPVGSHKVFFGAGPFLSYGLNGKSKVETITTVNGVSTTELIEVDVTFGDGITDTKRMDYGVGFLAGFKLNNGLLLNAGYDLGLVNLQPNPTNQSAPQTTIKSRVFTLSAGFAF